MAIRPILTVPDPVLKQVSKPVDAVTDETRALMDDMLETMYAAPGIGLAAVQIGDLRRIVVMDLGDGPPSEGNRPEGAEAPAGGEEPRIPNPRVFVNPEVLWASDETFCYEEGCLSIPDYFDQVERPARVRIAYLDREGRRVEEEIEGLYAELAIAFTMPTAGDTAQLWAKAASVLATFAGVPLPVLAPGRDTFWK